MTTVILLVLVLFSFFVLFFEGVQTPEEEKMKEIKTNKAEFSARVHELVDAYAPQLTELRQLLGGRTAQVTPLFSEEWVEYEQWECDCAGAGYQPFLRYVCTDKGVDEWLARNGEAFRAIKPYSSEGMKWSLDFSEGLHAGVAALNRQNPLTRTHRSCVRGKGVTTTRWSQDRETGEYALIS